MQTAPNFPGPNDAPLTLNEAAAAVPQLRGKMLHVSTLWRWARRGCRARNGTIVRLAHRRIGGTLTTTRADLDHFFEALAEADLASFRAEDKPAAGTVPSINSPALRRAQKAHAKAVLDAAGI